MNCTTTYWIYPNYKKYFHDEIVEVPASWTEALKEKEKLEEMVRPLLEKYFKISDNKMRS